jgi:hypothetical protein
MEGEQMLKLLKAMKERMEANVWREEMKADQEARKGHRFGGKSRGNTV